MDRTSFQLLLEPCAVDGGVGRNLEYDSRHILMCNLAEGTPEQEFGETVVAAQEPDWNKILELSLELSRETRDLRLAVLLTESLCSLHGLQGLLDGLTIVSTWVSDFWKDLHPQLEDEDEDAIERLGCLNRLCHNDYLIRRLKQLTLAQDEMLGKVTLADLRVRDEPEQLTQAEIRAIALGSAPAELSRQAELLDQCLECVANIQKTLHEHLGSGSWNPGPLQDAFQDCLRFLRADQPSQEQFNSRENANSVDSSDETNSPQSIAEGATSSTTPAVASVAQIQSRTEAVAMIDALCLYFETHEPASPVPLLLQRAKRLIPMSFVDILRELAPDGLSQAMQTVGGEDPSV